MAKINETHETEKEGVVKVDIVPFIKRFEREIKILELDNERSPRELSLLANLASSQQSPFDKTQMQMALVEKIQEQYNKHVKVKIYKDVLADFKLIYNLNKPKEAIV